MPFYVSCHWLRQEATFTLVPVWKRGVSKWGILKNLISHVLNYKSWIKLNYEKITYIYCVINEFNPTFEVQNMGNEAFQNASFWNAMFWNASFWNTSFWNALFPNGNEGYSCLWAISMCSINILELLTIFHEHLCFVLTANFVDHIDFYKFAKFLAFLELTWQVYKSLCSPRS